MSRVRRLLVACLNSKIFGFKPRIQHQKRLLIWHNKYSELACDINQQQAGPKSQIPYVDYIYSSTFNQIAVSQLEYGSFREDRIHVAIGLKERKILFLLTR